MIPEIPLWVGFAQAAGFAVWSFVVALVGTRCALRLAIGPKPEGTPGEHWTASARRLWPARRNVATAMFFFPVFAAGSVLTIGARIVLPLYFVAGAAFVAAVAGAQIAGKRFRRLLDPAPSAGTRAQLVGMLSLSLVLYILVYIALLFAALMPSGFSAAGVVWAAALAALTHGVTRGIGLRLAVLCRVASRAPRSLEARVDALAAAIGHAPVPVYVIRTPMLNAFALPRLPAVAVTDALLRHMTPAEVDGILAHELGHITEGRAVQNVRVLLAWIPFVVLTTVYVMRSLSVDPTVQVGSLFVLVFLHLKLSGTFLRKQEARADAVAHGHQHEDGVYARALEKIYRLNAVPAVLAGRGKSHPHLYDRMVAAGVTPDYPRPEPPSQRRASLASAVVLVVAVVGFVVGVIFSQTLLAPPISDSRSGEAH